MSEPNRTNAVPSNQGEAIRYLRLGDLELWILPDTFLLQEASLFALEAAEHEIAELVRDYLLPGNQLRFSACPILLKKDGNLILIDTGITGLGTHSRVRNVNLVPNVMDWFPWWTGANFALACHASRRRRPSSKTSVCFR